MSERIRAAVIEWWSDHWQDAVLVAVAVAVGFPVLIFAINVADCVSGPTVC